MLIAAHKMHRSSFSLANELKIDLRHLKIELFQEILDAWKYSMMTTTSYDQSTKGNVIGFSYQSGFKNATDGIGKDSHISIDGHFLTCNCR